ncbi:MAG: 4-hydroxy-tetrahydrodipicolinate reductase [Deltaproteobacteria bacterium]|nr:MAG: 4-hydroxy-tetrahydrodipicolinate reductase [Deltaproteobacteria bacterium]
MIRVALCGARGRMGRRLAELVSDSDDLSLSAILERPEHPELGGEFHGLRLGSDLAGALDKSDCLLDFSLPDGIEKRVAACAEAGVSFVSGITGLSDERQRALDRAAEKIAVVWAPNMSRGVYVLGRLVELAAGLLSDYHAEIFEIHHAGKADSPSGTAYALAEAIAARREGAETVYGRQSKRQPGEIGISAARGGDVVGEHQVMFLAAGEQVILTHRATSRDHFCRGALDAVRFAAKAKAGRYTMKDVFGGE